MIQSIALVIAFTAPVPEVLAEDVKATSFSRLLHIAHETASLDLAIVDRGADENWAVVRVVPERRLGKNGRLQPASFWTADTVATLRGTVPLGQWMCRPRPHIAFAFGTPPVYDHYRPFYDNDACVCRVNQGSLEEPCLIPDSWAEHVKPALAYWRANRELFADGLDLQRRERLGRLASDPNPVLAFMACRILAKAGALSLDGVPHELLCAKDALGMMVDFLLLNHCAKGSIDPLAKEISERIDAAKTIEELHGLGVACALDLSERIDDANRKVPERVPERVEATLSFKLLIRFEARVKALSKPGESVLSRDSILHDVNSARRVLELREQLEAETRAETKPVAK